MIDMHSHILPKLDDGAQTLNDALEMAKIAVEDGITDIVATPHTHDGIYHNRQQDVLNAVDCLQKTLIDNRIPLRIHPGNEVHIHLEIIENVISYESLTIGNKGKHLLLELPTQSIPLYAEDLFYELQIEGITPIIAHPERNVVLREHPERMVRWIEQGILAQVTAGSMLGYLGERAKDTAEYMIRNRLVHIIGSDAHNTRNRKPILKYAYRFLEDLTSKEEANMYRAASEAILMGEDCRLLEPVSIGKKKKRFYFF